MWWVLAVYTLTMKLLGHRAFIAVNVLNNANLFSTVAELRNTPSEMWASAFIWHVDRASMFTKKHDFHDVFVNPMALSHFELF